MIRRLLRNPRIIPLSAVIRDLINRFLINHSTYQIAMLFRWLRFDCFIALETNNKRGHFLSSLSSTYDAFSLDIHVLDK